MENIVDKDLGKALFVVDIDLEDTREAVKGCAEFFEKEQDDLIGTIDASFRLFY
jgi:hypothetical protein